MLALSVPWTASLASEQLFADASQVAGCREVELESGAPHQSGR